MDSYYTNMTRRQSTMTVPAIRIESPCPSHDSSNALLFDGSYFSPDESFGLSSIFNDFIEDSNTLPMTGPLSPIDDIYGTEQYLSSPSSDYLTPSEVGHDATQPISPEIGALAPDQSESYYQPSPNFAGLSLLSLSTTPDRSVSSSPAWPGGFYLDPSPSPTSEPYLDPPPSPLSWRSLSIEPSPLLSIGSLSPSPTTAELGSPSFPLLESSPSPASSRVRLTRSISAHRASPYEHRSSSSLPSNDPFLPAPEASGSRRRSFPTTERPAIEKGIVATEAMRAANERRRRNPAQHQCDICVQTFTTQFSLTRHKQSHTGEKPYICSHTGCGQTFFNSSDCKRHERSTRKHPNSNTIASGRRGVAAPPE